jgi:hypothetical protein
VMLDQPGDISVILKHENGLAQNEGFLSGAPAEGARSALSLIFVGQRDCKSCVNSRGSKTAD